MVIIDSFKELYEVIKTFIIKHKSILIKIGFFIILFTTVYILSLTLTKVSFLGKLDLTDPNNVAEEQPLVNMNMRKAGIVALILSFVAIATAVGRWQGFASVLSMVLSVFTVYKLIVPLLLLGWNPPLVTFFGGAVVISGSLFFSHGFNIKTLVAITGGLATLVVTMALGELFRRVIQVSGYHGDATYNLLVNAQVNFDMGGIILSGIILAGIGLLDDITITQTSVIKEIILANPKLKIIEIYNRAMNVGRDHAGALINSLFWAYGAASLTLLMLMNYVEITLDGVINYEFFMEEFLRVFVSTIGLLLSIPITTFIGAILLKKYQHTLKEDEEGHSHSHSHGHNHSH